MLEAEKKDLNSVGFNRTKLKRNFEKGPRHDNKSITFQSIPRFLFHFTAFIARGLAEWDHLYLLDEAKPNSINVAIAMHSCSLMSVICHVTLTSVK